MTEIRLSIMCEKQKNNPYFAVKYRYIKGILITVIKKA